MTTPADKDVLIKFAARLATACDDSPNIPPHGKGRQVVIADGLGVSQEAVRKWFAAESMPRPKKMMQLASFLDVDHAWLSLGIRPEISRDAKKLAGRIAEGAVLIVAGQIQLSGGNCAFPDENDPKCEFVHIYAIVKGHKLDIYVSSAKELEDGSYEFVVPRQYPELRCVGFLQKAATVYTLIELPFEMIEHHKVKRAGDFTVNVSFKDGRFVSGRDEWPLFKL